EDIPACAALLSDLGVEPLRRMRRGGPVVIAGGAGVSANPLPVAAIVDAVALGEGEAVIDPLARILDEHAGNREEALEALAGEPGIYLPGAPGRPFVPVPVDAARAAQRFQHSCVVAREAAFPGAFLVEISRGCPGACAFCLATVLYRPFRTMPLQRFESLIDSLPPQVDSVGLVSTAAAAHPDIVEILDLLGRKGLRAGVSSLRAEDIDERTAAALKRAGIRSAALAPESGSERLRMRLGKRVADEVFLEAGRLLAGAGVRRLSLYLLAGAPGEDEADLEETVRFVGRFAAASAGARIVAHLNPLVPKPGTPLQFMAMSEPAVLAGRAALLAARLRPLGVAVSAKGIRGAVRQAQLSMGDEPAGEAAARYAAGGTSWRRALIDSGVDPGAVFRERGLEEALPWETFASPRRRNNLLERYRAACGSEP
ncbi:MAG: radical SAM protein, partial [Candidatus Krumholzibacteria bacterium]|nr:radical SAM protein [Candidatus Krumholzibacteria bacterium]